MGSNGKLARAGGVEVELVEHGKSSTRGALVGDVDLKISQRPIVQTVMADVVIVSLTRNVYARARDTRVPGSCEGMA